MLEQEKRFVDEYLVDLNPKQAAIRAGYKGSTARYAYEWLTETLPNSTEKRHLPYKPEIKQYIDSILSTMHSEKIASVEEVLEFLTSVLRGEALEQVLRGMGDGVQTVEEIVVCIRERLKAAELLGKYHSLWTEKMRIDGNHQVVIVDDISGGGSNA